MNEEQLNARLDRLTADAPPPSGWGDVLRRAGGLRRRRQRRTVLLVLGTACVALAATFAAAGQIASMLSHSTQPHLTLRGPLRMDGRRIGTVELELHGAAVKFAGRRVDLRPWGPHRVDFSDATAATFRTRWFVTYDGLGDVDKGMLGDAQLCHPCGGRDSGRVDLSWRQASAVLNGDVAFSLLRDDGSPVATARLVLDRTHLQRGFQCFARATGKVRCSPIYSGKA